MDAGGTMDPRIKSAGDARRELAVRSLLAPAILIVLLVAQAFAQAPATDIGTADRATIRGVIESQIAAFRRA